MPCGFLLPRSGQPVLPGDMMPMRGSLGVHAERRSMEPRPGRFISNGPTPAPWRSAPHRTPPPRGDLDDGIPVRAGRASECGSRPGLDHQRRGGAPERTRTFNLLPRGASALSAELRARLTALPLTCTGSHPRCLPLFGAVLASPYGVVLGSLVPLLGTPWSAILHPAPSSACSSLFDGSGSGAPR
jgi:hypothetical protein